MKDFNIQLFGVDMPPLYGYESILDKFDKISAIDEKINELAIEREELVKAVKEEIKKANSVKD